MDASRSIARGAGGWIALGLVLALVAIWQQVRTIGNWDVVAYTASAISLEGVDDATLHRRTYESVRRSVDDATWQDLTGNGEYRRTVAAEPAALREQLPFYRTRPLYVGAIEALALCGMAHLDAIRLLGTIPVILVALLCMAWLRSRLEPWPATLVVLGIVPLLLAVVYLGTPDALALLLGTAAGWLLVARRQPVLAAAALVLAVLARPDMLLVAFALAAWQGLFEPSRRAWILAALLAGLPAVAVTLTHRLVDGYAWSVLMHHTFAHPLAWPRTRPAGFGLADYLDLLPSLPGSVSQGMTGAVGLLWVIAMLGGRNVPKADARPMRLLLAVTGASLVLHVVLFPVFWDRFLGTQLLLTAVAAAVLLARRDG